MSNLRLGITIGSCLQQPVKIKYLTEFSLIFRTSKFVVSTIFSLMCFSLQYKFTCEWIGRKKKKTFFCRGEKVSSNEAINNVNFSVRNYSLHSMAANLGNIKTNKFKLPLWIMQRKQQVCYITQVYLPAVGCHKFK